MLARKKRIVRSGQKQRTRPVSAQTADSISFSHPGPPALTLIKNWGNAMAGSRDEFLDVFRSNSIKAIYLCQKYRSLKALNEWLEEEESSRITKYNLLVRKTTLPGSDNPTADLKAYESIHEARAHLFGRSNEILLNISNHSANVGEITDETPKEILSRLKADLRTFEAEAVKIADQEKDKADETIKLLRGECERSPYRSKVLLLLLLLKEDFYQLIDKYLLQVRAYCSSGMEQITMIEVRRDSLCPEGVERFTEDHASCDFQKKHIIVCSQLSSLEDAFDSLFDETPRNILALQEASKKLLLIQLANKNFELLTSIVEAKLDLCLNLKNFREACEVLLKSYADVFCSVVPLQIRSIWEKELNGRVEALVYQEKRKVETLAQILVGQEQNCAGVHEAEQYLFLLKKEHDAKIDDVLHQVGLAGFAAL